MFLPACHPALLFSLLAHRDALPHLFSVSPLIRDLFINIFLAVLLDNFNSVRIQPPKAADLAAGGVSFKAASFGGVSRTASFMRKGSPSSNGLDGYSFLVFGPRNSFRLLCLRIVSHSAFETFSLIIILVSSICLALDSPRLDNASVTYAAVKMMNTIFVVLFAAEMALKLVAFGVYLPTNAYLKSGWRVFSLAALLALLPHLECAV